MLVSVLVHEEYVLVMGSVESEEVIGDVRRRVVDGETFLGLTYQQWRELGDGPHEIDLGGSDD